MVGRGGGPGMSRIDVHAGTVWGEQLQRQQHAASGEGKRDGGRRNDTEDDRSAGSGGDGSSSGKKRRSRWDGEGNDTEGSRSKRRRSRWAAEDRIQLTGGVRLEPELQALTIRLLEINRKLQTGVVLDSTSDGNRSPSPEPMYDNMGIRINTRDYRAREKLTRDRQEVLAMLIKKSPAFKPPADYKPLKHYKKLYIPVKEYPGYSFMGLIIGPRGNTQKRMQKETGATIVIRGKGSVREGRSARKPDPSENEDLHVLVEANTEDALEKAAGMVEKLLVPVEEGRNEHKRAQLREIAVLNGTLRDDEYCRLCGEPGHRQYACPARHSTFKSDVSCRICGDGGHPTTDCPLKGPAQGKKMDDEYESFLAELGGGGEVGSSRQSGPALALSGRQGGLPWSRGTAGGGGFSGGNGKGVPGLGAPYVGVSKGAGGKLNKDDDANLYVGYLPSTVDDDGLARLFSPFGVVEQAKVIRDRLTGATKGYGFVKYADPQSASAAVAQRNGYRLEGRVLAVRVAGPAPPPRGMGGPPGRPPQGAGDYPMGGGGGHPPQMQTAGPPRGPPGGDNIAPPPWIATPGPMHQYYNPYGPPPQGQGNRGALPGHYGGPYNNKAGGPHVGAPPASNGRSNMVESEYERFMSEMGR